MTEHLNTEQLEAHAVREASAEHYHWCAVESAECLYERRDAQRLRNLRAWCDFRLSALDARSVARRRWWPSRNEWIAGAALAAGAWLAVYTLSVLIVAWVG